MSFSVHSEVSKKSGNGRMEFHAKYIDEYNPAKLFNWYPGQQEPQEVMISVDIRDGQVSARYNPEVGNAISKAEFEGNG